MKTIFKTGQLCRKAFWTVLPFLMLPAFYVSAQTSPCSDPPSCIVNNELASSGYGDLDSPSTIAGWHVAYGTPTIFGNDCPTSTSNSSIWMWSYSSNGEGVYTCYNFQAGQTYRVCLWVRNTNGISNGGHLWVKAVSGSGSQVIANSFTNNQTWTQETYTFTANSNYSQLWIFPFMTADPVNGQYELQIDDIRVTPTTNQPGNTSISASPQTIDWCQSSTLTVNNAPSGATVSWTPSTGLSATTGLSVSASPCETTTYTATVTDPSAGSSANPPSGCAQCDSGGTFILTKQVTVNPPSLQIVGDTTIRCGDSLVLQVLNPLSCGDVTYEWHGPNGHHSSNSVLSFGNASSADAGTYTVTITNQNGGCSYNAFINIKMVDCPCETHPDFSWNGCNPVDFFNWNTSTTSHEVAWFWDFGDGNSSTEMTPTHYYGQPGNYLVCLTTVARNDRGETCCDQVCREIEICDTCVGLANFNSEIDYYNNTVSFTDLSVGTGAACNWYWDFGDGNFSNQQSPNHTYSSPGFYYVCLTTTFCIPDSNGYTRDSCSFTICHWVILDERLSAYHSSAKSQTTSDDIVKVFPNPASTEIFVAASEALQPRVRVINASGQEVSKALLSGKNLYRIDISSLTRGMYIVEVLYTNGTIKRMQFVKS